MLKKRINTFQENFQYFSINCLKWAILPKTELMSKVKQSFRTDFTFKIATYDAHF